MNPQAHVTWACPTGLPAMDNSIRLPTDLHSQYAVPHAMRYFLHHRGFNDVDENKPNPTKVSPTLNSKAPPPGQIEEREPRVCGLQPKGPSRGQGVILSLEGVTA